MHHLHRYKNKNNFSNNFFLIHFLESNSAALTLLFTAQRGTDNPYKDTDSSICTKVTSCPIVAGTPATLTYQIPAIPNIPLFSPPNVKCFT